jgi:hypothetical protein
MTRVVLAMDVIVASLIQPGGGCGRLLDQVADGAVDARVDDRILAEYPEVLSRLQVAASAHAVLATGILRRFPEAAIAAVRVLSPAKCLETLRVRP